MFLYVFFFRIEVEGQFLSPPYKVSFDSTNNDLNFYYFEADFFSDNKNEVVTYQSGPKIRNSLKFFNHKLGVIDAVNAKDHIGWFEWPYALHTEDKDILLIAYNSKHKVSIKSIVISPNKNARQKTIYEFYTGNEFPQVHIQYLMTGENILIVTVSTQYPSKHDFRRILAFDVKSLQLLWEKYTADYILFPFYSREYNPSVFYYTTAAFFNGLHFSNSTFYRTDAETYLPYIDTAFTTKHFPHPDVNALDYSTDSCNYFVKMSLTGKVIWRKKLGGKFLSVNPVYNYPQKTQYFLFLNRRDAVLEYYSFDLSSDSLRKIDLSGSGITIHNYGFFNDKVYINNSGYFKIYSLNLDKLRLDKEVNLDPKIDLLTKVNDYYIAHTAGYNLFYDNDFNLLGTSEKAYPLFEFVWSDALNQLMLRRPNNSRVVKFKKQSLYERINDKTKQLALWGAVSAVFILTIFWLLTMRISRKKIALKNKELEIATAQLIHSEKLAVLGTVAASFAHQLNSPIGAILNSAQRLSEKISDENLDLISRSAEYCKTMVSKFLIASRPVKEDQQPCCAFTEVWKEWFSLFKDEFISHSINIKTDLKYSNYQLNIKKIELNEIITNIMFNARDSIMLANKQNKFINISAKRIDNFIRITFSDSGAGFGDEILENAFEPFYTSKPVGTGTGLGLWITKRLVNKSGGKISISNTPDGAKIVIEIPICE